MSRVKTKSGHLAIVQVTVGGLIEADGDGKFIKDFPFVLKNNGEEEVTLSVRLAGQEVGESYALVLYPKGHFSEELIAEVLADIPVTHLIKWGA